MSDSQTSLFIELRLIKANPANPRKIITQIMIDSMAASLKAVGLKNPIKVITLANGTYEVISRHIRLAGATQLGWATIPAVVLTLTPEQARLEAILDNRGQQMNWLETAEAIFGLLQTTPKPTQQAVADMLGIGQDDVSRKMKVLSLLTPASKEAIYGNSIKVYAGDLIPEVVVRRLADLADPQKVEEALKVAIDKKMTETQAKTLVASMLAGGSADAHTPVKPTRVKATPKVQAGSPNSGISSPSAQTALVGSGPQDAAPHKMSEGETLAWDTVAGISVISRIKTKIKKGERPSFFEALLLAGHYVWRALVWINKNGFKLIGHILKFTGKLLLEALKSIAKAFGETFYKVARFVVIIVILGGMAWLAWDIYHHWPLHPFKLGMAKVWPAHPTPEPTAVPTPAATPITTMVAEVSTLLPQTVSKPVASSDSGTHETAYVGDLEKTSTSKPTMTAHPVQPTPIAQKTDIAGDVLKQAAPAGVDVAKKLFGL